MDYREKIEASRLANASTAEAIAWLEGNALKEKPRWNAVGKLQEATLDRANLQGAKLRGAKLRGADLRRANLKEAILHETGFGPGFGPGFGNPMGGSLRGANLQGATGLTQKQLDDTCGDAKTKLSPNLSIKCTGGAEALGTGSVEAWGQPLVLVD